MSVDYLAKLHPHERDSRILFDEPTHVYTIDGISNYTSVTTWIHSHFEKFDSDKVIDNMMKSKNWPNNKYFEYDRETIKKIWDGNRDIAAKEGTKMHYDIECYYNNCENANDTNEYSYFKNFLKDFPNLKPYRTEWTVFHEELRLAGSIDMIFENDDGTLQIYDWKRCKDIVKTNNWNKYSINENINHLPDTNYWHYCLQLNTYKAILELKYNKKVTDLYLVCLHPDKKNYERIKVVNLENEIIELFNERKIFLN
jgi:ATP-dependent exoDNAse (exonuclease V) beta subunit